ncbi:hypothetical protein [Nonlabens antarcticus]|uniref:hypothetical protein n=1 Tax=Nonlabens antarcticus TaxID=392714 RepID=UPI001890BF80|nr:hypothetical protein [Nonlabens antarcticus]
MSNDHTTSMVIDAHQSQSRAAERNETSRTNYVLDLYNSFMEEYRSGSVAYATISLLGQSCLASVAAMVLLMNPSGFSRPVQMIELFLVTIFCMGFNASVLSQQKEKFQVNLLIVSVLVSLTVICLHLF